MSCALELTKAAQEGDLETFKRLYRDQYEGVWQEAAKYEQIDILRYMKSIGVVFDEYHLQRAAVYGFVECFKFFHSECGISVNAPNILYNATRSSFRLFQYAHEAGAEFDTFTVLAAASDGNIDCLRYAVEHGAYVHNDTLHAAVLSGNFDCIRYCVEKLFTESTKIDNLYHAAAKCKVEIFRWLHQHPKLRASIPSEVMSCAVFYDNVDVLQYIYKQGVRWPPTFRLVDAFHGGKLESIAFAMQHGCHDPLITKSVIKGMVEEFESLGESWRDKIESCWNKQFVRKFLWAFYHEHLDVIQWTKFGQVVAACFMNLHVYVKACDETLFDYLPRDIKNYVLQFI